MLIITAGADFEAVSAIIFFPIGSMAGAKESINVTILDDMAFEKNEDFWIHLSSEPAVYISMPYVNVTIIDDEGM